jgi:hypothetical protein
MENQFNRNVIKCKSDEVMLYPAFRVLFNLFVVFDSELNLTQLVKQPKCKILTSAANHSEHLPA